MAAYVGGDRSAFAVLFERYAPRLLRLMQRDLGRGEDAHDLVQQTFLQLHRARRDFRAGAKLRPWLFTIALNLKRQHFRRQGRRPARTSSTTSTRRSRTPRSTRRRATRSNRCGRPRRST